MADRFGAGRPPLPLRRPTSEPSRSAVKRQRSAPEPAPQVSPDDSPDEGDDTEKLRRTSDRRSATTRSASRLSDVARALDARREADQGGLERLERVVRALAREDPVLKLFPCRTVARIKSPWSALLKLRRKGLRRVDDLHDVAGLRVVVRPHANDGYHLCDRVLDVLRAHPEVAAVGDVKDFVRRPKENGYQSLHAVVALRARGCSRVEVQIRTEAMEYVATHGSAAHKDYFTSQFSFLDSTPETPYRSLGSGASS